MAKDMRLLKHNFLNSVSDSNMCEGKLIIKFFLNKYQNYHVSGYENPILHVQCSLCNYETEIIFRMLLSVLHSVGFVEQISLSQISFTLYRSNNTFSLY